MTATYDTFAPIYDDYTSGYQAERWTGRLAALAQRRGAPERGRLLDIGCGTGKSFLPMIERGWEVTGCDISAAMVEEARPKVGDSVRLEVADMRELPEFGAFDLVWALNDAVNNLLSEEEVVSALKGMKRNLAPGGVILFDLNTVSICRLIASEVEVRAVDGGEVRWTGLGESEFEPGGLCEARLEISGDEEAAFLHRQRHFPEGQVIEALASAGLECLDVFGDYEGAQDKPLDEERHQKAIYVAG
jgi:SAM-dependent methyltransferase